MALSDLSIEDFELEDKILELNQKLRDVKVKYQNICKEADKLASDELISPKISSNDEDTFDIDVKMEAVKAQAKNFVATTKDLKQKLGASGIKKVMCFVNCSMPLTQAKVAYCDFFASFKCFRNRNWLV